MPPTGGSRMSLVELGARSPYDQKLSLAPFNASGVFSPGEPIAPPESEQVRILDYRVGENRFWTPRSSERWTFQFLRNMADGHDLTRLAIETRKDQVERLDLSIRPIDKKKRNSAGDARIAAVEAMVRFPDGETDF